MLTAVQFLAVLIDEQEVSLVDDSGGLQGLRAAFRGQVEGREAAQFLVNDGHDLIECAPFAAVPAPEQGSKFRGISSGFPYHFRMAGRVPERGESLGI